jgi:hypothetical protein
MTPIILFPSDSRPSYDRESFTCCSSLGKVKWTFCITLFTRGKDISLASSLVLPVWRFSTPKTSCSLYKTKTKRPRPASIFRFSQICPSSFVFFKHPWQSRDATPHAVCWSWQWERRGEESQFFWVGSEEN